MIHVKIQLLYPTDESWPRDIIYDIRKWDELHNYTLSYLIKMCAGDMTESIDCDINFRKE